MKGPEKQDILEVLKTVIDPAKGADVVSLALISGLVVREGHVSFALDVGQESGREKEPLRRACEKAIKKIPGVISVQIVLTAERQPKPEPELMKPSPGISEKIDLPTVKTIVAVASGKGGVGKSTLAVNLALALQSLGHKVGLLDADIYGPSIPRLLNIKDHHPTAKDKKIQPLEAYGLKIMSMGFLVDEDKPMIWRGPMVSSALQQMVRDVVWGELDILVVDMPPGTGDIQLTLAQKVPVTGVVIVSTPQDIALIDARKGLKMFLEVNVPVLGIVENMSSFVCPHCGEASHIFAHGGAKKIAKELGMAFLGAIPLHMAIREASDAGEPIVVSASQSDEAKAFVEIAKKVSKALLPGG